jgi:hypothetical protein
MSDRDGALTFGDLIGQLDHLEIACPKCDRLGRYSVRRLALQWLAGGTYAWPVLVSENRTACSIAPLPTTSSWRTRPGRIGSPAASADVQRAGRTWFFLRSHIAPLSAFQQAFPSGNALKSSYSVQESRSRTITCRSPFDLGPPSIGAFGGIG